MKHLKHLFTALLILCSLTATAHNLEIDGIYYNITNYTNKTVEVTYKGNYYYSYSDEYTGSVVIPENVTYNGTTYSVTSIGEYAFWCCDGLTSITIPNSVTSIGSEAFYDCTGLKVVHISDIAAWCSIGFFNANANPLYNAKNLYLNGELVTDITIPNSVTSIGDYTFRGCTGLTSITIPNSVTSIGGYAFSYCSGLTGIEIPNSVTSIGDWAFNGCTGLTSVEIPNSVTSIGDWAFYGCTGLTSITIPNSVTSIGEDAFSDCTGLTSIEIPNSVTSIGDWAFYGCTGLTSITIPNSVTSIGEWAFCRCTGLTSIVIPNSVTSIGSYAFYNCTGLTSVVIGNGVTSIGSSAFYYCTGLTSVYNLSNLTFSKGSSSNGYVAYYADKVYNAPNISIEDDFIFGKPNGVNTLVGYLGNATELTLPADYNGENYVIGNDAFRNCTGLTSITIPNSVTSIGSSAFRGCTGLKKLFGLLIHLHRVIKM